eukprot:1142257-Pelagomonas_calceolata.AAC.1
MALRQSAQLLARLGRVGSSSAGSSGSACASSFGSHFGFFSSSRDEGESAPNIWVQHFDEEHKETGGKESTAYPRTHLSCSMTHVFAVTWMHEMDAIRVSKRACSASAPLAWTPMLRFEDL